MLEFSVASVIPVQKVMVADDSLDLSFQDSDNEDTSSFKQPRCTYLCAANPDSPLEDSMANETDLEPDSPCKSVNLPTFTVATFSSPNDRSTLFTEPTHEETRHNWGNYSTKTIDARKFEDSLDVTDFAKEIVSNFYPAASCSETRDDLFVQEQSLEDSIELTLKCVNIFNNTKKYLAARRITKAARKFILKQRKAKAAEKFKNLCDSSFKQKLEEFKQRKLAYERKLKRRALLIAVVRGWRTRRILKKCPGIRHIKEKLRTAMPFAAKRLKARLIETLQRELSHGSKSKGRKYVRPIRKHAFTSQESPTVIERKRTDSCPSVFNFLGPPRPLNRLTLQTAPITPKNRLEIQTHRRQSSLDEFCILEALTKQQIPVGLPKKALPVALRQIPRQRPVMKREKSLAPMNLQRTVLQRRRLSKASEKPAKLKHTLDTARQLLCSLP